MPLICPSEPRLLLFALNPGSEPDGALARHLSECAACRDQVAELGRVARGIEASAAPTAAGEGDCLDAVALAEIADGGDDAGRRAERIAHLAVCGRCRQQLAAVVELLADPEVAAELRQLRKGDGRWTLRGRHLIGAGLVAAAILLVVAIPRKGIDRSPVHRDPTITAAASPVAVAPIGDVADAALLRWVAVSGVDRYRVTLFDAAGVVRYQTETVDTLASIPDSIPVVPGQSYLWKVEGRTQLGRWASSDLVEFRVMQGRSP